MIIPQFLRFYNGYTLATVMQEYAVAFFTLVNTMYRLQASESLATIRDTSVPQMDKHDSRRVISELREGAKGISGVVNEVRNLE